MTEPTPRADVARFVAAVRAELGDLAPDVVDELTGGLAGDLTAGLAAGGPVSPSMDDPVGYARDLRVAAGLEPRVYPEQRRQRRGLRARVVTRMNQARDGLEAQPWWPSVRDFLVTVRPAWWVARAYAVYFVLLALTGSYSGLLQFDPASLLLLVALVVLSVQVGRRSASRVLTVGRLRYAVLGANLLAIVTLPVLGERLKDPAVYDGEYAAVYEEAYSAPPFLTANGREVINIFPYDAAGHPLSGVQLFDQDGIPISVVAQPCPESGRAVGVAARDHRGDRRWNVFPLREKVVADPVNYPCDVMAGPTTEPTQPAPPMVVVPPLTEPTPEPSATTTDVP